MPVDVPKPRFATTRRGLQPPDAVTRELQALVRLRDDQVTAKTAASNQLGALLDAHWPGAKQLFFRLASKIALAFLSEYPSPQAAARLDQAELAAFCRRHAYRGGRHPAELLQRLRSAPTPPVGLDPGVLSQVVGAQVQLLGTLLATLAITVYKAMLHDFEQSRDTASSQALDDSGALILMRCCGLPARCCSKPMMSGRSATAAISLRAPWPCLPTRPGRWRPPSSCPHSQHR